jgi:hypothetical protein
MAIFCRTEPFFYCITAAVNTTGLSGSFFSGKRSYILFVTKSMLLRTPFIRDDYLQTIIKTMM